MSNQGVSRAALREQKAKLEIEDGTHVLTLDGIGKHTGENGTALRMTFKDDAKRPFVWWPLVIADRADLSGLALDNQELLLDLIQAITGVDDTQGVPLVQALQDLIGSKAKLAITSRKGRDGRVFRNVTQITSAQAKAVPEPEPKPEPEPEPAPEPKQGKDPRQRRVRPQAPVEAKPTPKRRQRASNTQAANKR